MTNRRLHPEMGAIVVLFVLSIPALLGLSVLSLDAGYLYLTKSRLDKASRIASATTLNMMALRGWGAIASDTPQDQVLGYRTAAILNKRGEPHIPPPPTALNTTLLDQAQLATLQSLKPYFPDEIVGADESSSTLRSDHLRFNDGGDWRAKPGVSSMDLKNSSVSFQLQYDARTLLLGTLAQLTGNPNCGSRSDGYYRCGVQTAARTSGQLRPAKIKLLLDTSGSMAGTKMARLQEAAIHFVDMFNPLQDEISVIQFSTSAKSLQTGFDEASSSDPDFLRIKTDIRDRLKAGGQTNPCDALLQARDSIGNPNASDANFVVLFTDGAPNVYRLDFNDKSVLSTALTNGGLKSGDDRGWYGWTVKWGKRELSSCPSSDPPDCDPVFGWPSVKDETGKVIASASVKTSLELDDEGVFRWKTPGQPDGETLAQKRYTIEWDEKVTKDYRWFGPSYLVHASFDMPLGASLIDRIPASMAGSNLITCGPGSRGNMPGASWKRNDPSWKDMYNHSLYFASRVINKNWNLSQAENIFAGDPQTGRFNLKGMHRSALTPPGVHDDGNLIAAPGYFKKPAGKGFAQPLKTLGSDEENPGCLSSLNGHLPGDPSAHIWVGKEDNGSSGNLNDSIVSNSDSQSIRMVGEVVKTAELPYYCAVRTADLLRSRGVVIFTIGLGTSASDSCNDPMQNALDFDSRKDGFLRRLAYAAESLHTPGDPSQGWSTDSNFTYVSNEIHCPSHPLDGQVISRGYSQSQPTPGTTPIANDPPPSGTDFGSYYGSNDSSKLRGIFAKVAKQVLLRLSG